MEIHPLLLAVVIAQLDASLEQSHQQEGLFTEAPDIWYHIESDKPTREDIVCFFHANIDQVVDDLEQAGYAEHKSGSNVIKYFVKANHHIYVCTSNYTSVKGIGFTGKLTDVPELITEVIDGLSNASILYCFPNISNEMKELNTKVKPKLKKYLTTFTIGPDTVAILPSQGTRQRNDNYVGYEGRPGMYFGQKYCHTAKEFEQELKQAMEHNYESSVTIDHLDLEYDTEFF